MTKQTIRLNFELFFRRKLNSFHFHWFENAFDQINFPLAFSGSQPFSARVPLSKNEKTPVPLVHVGSSEKAFYDIFVDNPWVNLILMKNLAYPSRYLTRNSGWERLLQLMIKFCCPLRPLLFQSILRSFRYFKQFDLMLKVSCLVKEQKWLYKVPFFWPLSNPLLCLEKGSCLKLT